MNGLTPRRLLHYVTGRLRLRWYLQKPGDGRPQPQIPAQAPLWVLLMIGQILRESSFHAVEALVRSSARAPSLYRHSVCFGIVHDGTEARNQPQVARSPNRRNPPS